MELAELEQLVAAGESERHEFKTSTGELKAGMTTLCALLNGVGGRVVFGVTPSGRIVGQRVTNSTLQDVVREIRKLEPPDHIEQSLVPIAEARRVLILEANVAPSASYAYDGPSADGLPDWPPRGVRGIPRLCVPV